MFLNISVFQGRIVSTSPNQAGGPPFVGCPRPLIQFIRSYPPYRRPFLYPQPEDAPCRGDSDPLHGTYIYIYIYIYTHTHTHTHIHVVGLVAQTVQRLSTDWTVRNRITVGTRFSTLPDRPWGPPSLLCNGYRVFPGGKLRPGRAADH